MEAPRLWLVLARCHRALNQIAERSIEETGLGLTDFAALEALLHKGRSPSRRSTAKCRSRSAR